MVASLMAAAGALEIGLRLFVPAHFGTGGSRRFELDPDLIYRLRRANVVTWSTAEFVETSHTNALGLRGGELGGKRIGEQRILALGDSFTYGHGVQDDETYPAVLERRLRARGHDVTVQNAGVPGYSTDQAYTYFLREGAGLAPDLVLVGIHCSDISDNYEAPLYEIADGKLVHRDARRSRMYRLGSMLGGIPSLLQRSRLFDALLASVDWHEPASAHPAGVDLDAWSREKIRLEVNDLRARGAALHATVVVVLMPCKRTLGPDATDPFDTLPQDLRADGIPVLDAAAAMRRGAGDLAGLFFHDDPHLNAAGDARLAEAVAQFIDEGRLLLRPAADVGLATAVSCEPPSPSR